MVRQGDVYANPRTGTRVEFRELSPARLIFERRYPPATGKTDPHLHLDFTQSWEVVSGTATLAVDRESRTFGPGESVHVDAETKHQDPYNDSGEGLTVLWRIEPVNEFVEGFMNAYAHLLAHDRLNDQDEFPTLQLLVILRATRAKSYVASLPIGVQRATIPLLGALGRMRGYRPSYEQG